MKDSFSEAVYKVLRQVPKGKVCSYKDLAQAIKKPGASRAVGNAMNKNPYAPEVPCHRVVKSDGSLGGFASGKAAKIKLLKSEGIEVKDNKIVDFAEKRHHF